MLFFDTLLLVCRCHGAAAAMRAAAHTRHDATRRGAMRRVTLLRYAARLMPHARVRLRMMRCLMMPRRARRCCVRDATAYAAMLRRHFFQDSTCFTSFLSARKECHMSGGC